MGLVTEKGSLLLGFLACPTLGTAEPWCCRKGNPFQGPRVGSCVTLRNELSEETYVLAKKDTVLRRGTQAEISRVRELRRTAL